MYSRRPTSMPTRVSAGRVVQRGCEPSAINPLQGEKRERGRFLVACDIGTKRDLFNKAAAGSVVPLTLPPLSAHACVRLPGGAFAMRQGSLPLPAHAGRGLYGPTPSPRLRGEGRGEGPFRRAAFSANYSLRK